MDFVIGREGAEQGLPTATLGHYRALDGSGGAALGLDIDRPHAVLVVGKRGYGKSYTLGVIAEALARTSGVAPTLVDPMGVFATLERGQQVPARVIEDPTVRPEALDPRSWCELVSLSPESGAGSLVWQAAKQESSLQDMQAAISEADTGTHHSRAAANHVRLAQSWGVFDQQGIDATALGGPEATVVDVSGLAAAPTSAVCRGVGEALYRARETDSMDRLPWLLLDEAHVFFEGVAQSALERILTRGRAPGVSLVAATQRPSAVPPVCVSQSDILLAHRLTSQADIEALKRAQPTYVSESLDERMPTEVGEVVIVDDATETVHTAQIRQRSTPHGGSSPSVSAGR